MIKMETQEEFVIKRKRTKRPRPLSTSPCSTGSLQQGAEVEEEGEEEEEEEAEDTAKCLILLAQSCNKKSSPQELDKNVYQCKTCCRSFPSFQALGGHMASHKKPKVSENQECLNLDHLSLREQQNTMLTLQIPSRVFSCNSTSNTKQRVHECSICGAEFNSGQALGGHMRRHRPIPIIPTTNYNKEDEFPSQVQKKQRTILALDLNHPAPDDQDYPPTKEQVFVFSASPLVHCHY